MAANQEETWGTGANSGFRLSWSWGQPLPWGAEPWHGGEDGSGLRHSCARCAVSFPTLQEFPVVVQGSSSPSLQGHWSCWAHWVTRARHSPWHGAVQASGCHRRECAALPSHPHRTLHPGLVGGHLEVAFLPSP